MFKSPRFLLLAVAALALPLSQAHAADHLDAPSLAGNGQSDINDIFAFQSPTNANNTVLIMTVNPFAGNTDSNRFGGFMSPTEFATDVNYDFNIDNTGDAVSDVNFRLNFTPSAGNQAFTLTKDGVAVTTGTTGTASTAGTTQVSAGVFDDPFFFDLAGFNDGLNFTGDNFFQGANVSAIVLEVASSDLNGADSNIGIWGTTSNAAGQIDRMGRPAINTVLLSGDRKEDFNVASPDGDASAFGAEVNAAIAGLSDQANADALTPILLPDVLTFDTSSTDGFLNGRGLRDDVIDASLNLLTAGGVTGDMVGNDSNFLDVFPFLAAANPQAIPEPTTAVVGMMALIGLASVRRRRS